jgi:branched-chain amino acid transport system substrate-binding protein
MPLLISAACAASAPGTDDNVRIAFVQDLSAPDADEHVQPARQAAELAVAMHAPEGTPVELVTFDLPEEPSAIEEISSDPSFVAAIVGPGADGSALAEAGVPTVSVSTAGPTPADGSWRRFVAPIDVVAEAVAAELAGFEPCVLSEEPPPDALASLLTDRLGEPAATLDPAEAPPFAEANGCDAVAWAGSPDPGAELARALPDGVAILGGDRLLDPDFLDAGSAAEGARAACACADLSLSTDPEAMRFIQDYQSEFGTAPGPYAVEAWDAAKVILSALSGGSGREVVAAALRDLEVFEGLGTTYRLAATGELAHPEDGVGVSELRAGRWVRLEPPT